MNSRYLVCAIYLLCALGLAACSSNRAVQRVSGSALPAPAAVPSVTSDTDGGYHLGARDVVTVDVFGVPDLARTVRISADGNISLPLIGPVYAGGKTVAELETIIRDKLGESYLQNPQVSVFIKEFASQQVTLGGSVENPGVYPLTGSTSLLQAIAVAGGLTQLAQTDGVVVFREIEGKRMAAVFNVGQIQNGDAPDPRIYAGDIVVVHQSGSKNALQQFIRAAPAIGLFLLF